MMPGRRPVNIGGEGERWGRGDSVEVARTGPGGEIHLVFGDYLGEEDIWCLNMPDSVDMTAGRDRDIPVLDWRLR